MKRIKKFTAILLVLLIFLTGCQMADTSWVFELEGERLPAGAYIMFLEQAITTATDMHWNAWFEWEPSEDDPDEERPPAMFEMSRSEIFDSNLEGMRFYDWVISEAQTLSRRYFAAQSMLADLDIELDRGQVAEANAFARNIYQANSDVFREIGVAESSLALVQRYTVVLTTLFLELYGQGGDFEVPESEIRAYFSDNFLRGQELTIWKSWWFDAEDYDTEEEYAEARRIAEEENAVLRELAEEFLERMRAGEAIEDLQFDLDLAFAGDPNTVFRAPPGALDFLVRNNDPETSAVVLTGLMATPVGQSNIFEDDNTIRIIRRLDPFENPHDIDVFRSDILLSMRFLDDFLPMLDELANELPIIVNEAAIRRYRPDLLMVED